MAKKKTKTDWVKKALAECEKDRKNRRMPEEEYYLFRLEELAKELPDKPFGSTYVPPGKTEQVPAKTVVKTVYAGRQSYRGQQQQQIRY